MFFFMFPFGFLIPLVLITLGARFLVRILHDISDEEPHRYVNQRYDSYGVRTDAENGRRRSGRGLEARIFQLADRKNGRITLSDIVIETGLDIKEAEELIEGMIDEVHVQMNVLDNGKVVYEFPELINRNSN